MSANDIPVVSFFKRLLDPFMIWGLLIFSTWLYDETFSGYYLVLMIITFFISTYVFEQTSIYKEWRNGKTLVYIRDTVVGWSIIIFILVFLGFATKLSYQFSENVIFTWFVITPIALLVSHITVRIIADKQRKNGGLRSALIVSSLSTMASA